jgi:nitrite reductase/ring-hydroxylating ferredoxin subunit
MVLPFTAPLQRSDKWIYVGRASWFPDITESGQITLSSQQECSGSDTPKQGCKVFATFNTDGKFREATQIPEVPKDSGAVPRREDEQLLIFQYRGNFHAIDNVCLRSQNILIRGTHIVQALTSAEMSALFIPTFERSSV